MKNSIKLRKFQFTLIFSLAFSSNFYGQFSQNVLTESWIQTGGQGLGLKNATTTDDQRSVYVAGATNVGPNNTDVLVQKFAPDGGLVWQQTFAGSANLTDAATAIYVDENYDVYITGTVVNEISKGQDILVLKYSSIGTLQWTYTYHGSNTNIDDVGAGITGDPSGTSILVTGMSGNDQNMYDFKTFSFSPSDGSLIWSQSYDHNSLTEIPKRIFVDGNYVYVMGASQDSQNHWELATVQYDLNQGTFLNDDRTNSSTVTGIDEINDYALDNLGNIYIIGSIITTNGYDVAVYKLDSVLNLIWDNYYDINGLDDKGNGIEFYNGDVYLTGYSTTASLGTETLIMKLNSSGVVQWQREIGGKNGLNDSGEKLVIDSNGKIYVAASVNDGNGQDSRLYCLDGASNTLGTTSFNGGNNLDDIPQVINVDLDNNIIVTGSEQTNPNTSITRTIKYKLFERDYQFEYVNGKPSHLKGTILVRFKADKMKNSSMNARKFHGGLLNEFINDSTILAMYNKTGHDWSKFHTYKVLRNTSPADSLSITRMGDTIKANDLWTYLSIDIPENEDHTALCNDLMTLGNHIRSAELDVLCELFDVPNDSFYSSGQLGLYPNTIYPNSDINVENAWDIEKGIIQVKVGVLDSQISWKHTEFNSGVANLPGPFQKVGGGYNYYFMDDISNLPNFTYPHGTQVAGIIGARRNSLLGISGIAGGDISVGNYGAQLFSLAININGTDFAAWSTIAHAIQNAYSSSPANPNNYALDIINASWGTDLGPETFMKEAITECWKNHCVFVAARGQYSGSNGSNTKVWPACFNDLEVINVIASGTDGERKDVIQGNGSGNWSSNYGIVPGGGLSGCPSDLVAPGVIELVTSTIPSNNGYTTFSGTSAAAPHVTGVAALMLSRHHVLNGYPNNLSTEDIENIMQKTAYPKGGTVPNLENGYGLLNSTEALTQVTEPYYIEHLSGPSFTTLIENVDVTVFSGGTYENFNSSKKYTVEWDLDITLPLGHEIIDTWELEAGMKKGYKIFTAGPTVVFGANPLEEYNSVTVNNPIGTNNIQKTAKMVTYLMNEGSDNNSANDFWYPMHPSQLKYVFSVHVKKSADAGLFEHKTNFFSLFPNPSENLIKIHCNSNNNILEYEIMDISGRVSLEETLTPTNEININISSLSKGVYYVRVTSDLNKETLTFIKK